MKINIKGIGIEVTPALEVYIKQKLGSLAKFVTRFDERGSAEAWVEVSRTTKHHHKGEIFFAKADVVLPKKVLRAKHTGSNLRAALDIVKDTLRVEIKKYKDRSLLEERTK